MTAHVATSTKHAATTIALNGAYMPRNEDPRLWFPGYYRDRKAAEKYLLDSDLLVDPVTDTHGGDLWLGEYGERHRDWLCRQWILFESWR